MDTLISILWDPEQRIQLCYAWILDLQELRDLKCVLRRKVGGNLLQSEKKKKKNHHEFSIILAVTDLILFSQKTSHLPKQLVKHYLPDPTSLSFQNCTLKGKGREGKATRSSHGTSFLWSHWRIPGSQDHGSSLARCPPLADQALVLQFLGISLVIKHVEQNHATQTLVPDLRRRWVGSLCHKAA